MEWLVTCMYAEDVVEWLVTCMYADDCTYIHHPILYFLFLSSLHCLNSFLPPPYQAISGQAVDRHLNGLKLLTAEAGMETPALFKDVAYTRSVSHTLFTSNVCRAIKVILT